jgi:fimbrial chaperone protein
MLKKTIFFLTILLLAASGALAGEFSVSPITMELGPRASSGVFTVANTGREKINFQVSVSEWTQDAAGKDVYTETKDIVFFPRLMALEGGEQRVIRLGLKSPPALREKTYRLFIEEIPLTVKPQADGTRVTFAIRFAPPIFVRPAQARAEGAIDPIGVARGRISAVVRNTGNVHFRVNGLAIRGRSADGAELFNRETDGGYVLHGAARKIEVSFPPELCDALALVEVEAKTENMNLRGKLDVQKGMCGQ